MTATVKSLHLINRQATSDLWQQLLRGQESATAERSAGGRMAELRESGTLGVMHTSRGSAPRCGGGQVTVAVIRGLVVQPVCVPQYQRSFSQNMLIKHMRWIFSEYSSEPPPSSCNTTVTSSRRMTGTYRTPAAMTSRRGFWRIITLAGNSRRLGEEIRTRGATSVPR